MLFRYRNVFGRDCLRLASPQTRADGPPISLGEKFSEVRNNSKVVTGLMPEFTWTPEQVAAITSEEDTLLVANAGTGKTSTVVGKVLWQLGLDSGAGNESGDPIPPCANPCELSEIAAITFTEKGAADLKSNCVRR